MKKFNDPLDNIKIASPCSADWNQMYGDDRKRFCSDCRLNVYNLSNMTRQDAETLLINSEGPVCVTFYRRADGTVITRNCPVGLRAIRKRLSRTFTAVSSLMISFLVGIGFVRVSNLFIPMGPPDFETEYRESKPPKISFGGGISNLAEIKAAILSRE